MHQNGTWLNRFSPVTGPYLADMLFGREAITKNERHFHHTFSRLVIGQSLQQQVSICVARYTTWNRTIRKGTGNKTHRCHPKTNEHEMCRTPIHTSSSGYGGQDVWWLFHTGARLWLSELDETHRRKHRWVPDYSYSDQTGPTCKRNTVYFDNTTTDRGNWLFSRLRSAVRKGTNWGQNHWVHISLFSLHWHQVWMS